MPIKKQKHIHCWSIIQKFLFKNSIEEYLYICTRKQNVSSYIIYNVWILKDIFNMQPTKNCTESLVMRYFKIFNQEWILSICLHLWKVLLLGKHMVKWMKTSIISVKENSVLNTVSCGAYVYVFMWVHMCMCTCVYIHMKTTGQLHAATICLDFFFWDSICDSLNENGPKDL